MTTAFHTGVLIGPSAGGFIIEYISWRAVFFFLVPIALAGAVLSLFHRSKVETSTHAKSNTSQPAVDYLGAVLLAGATVGLIAVVDHRIMEAAGRTDARRFNCRFCGFLSLRSLLIPNRPQRVRFSISRCFASACFRSAV